MECNILKTPPPDWYRIQQEATLDDIQFPSLLSASPPPSPVHVKYCGTPRHWKRDDHDEDMFGCLGQCGHATSGSQYCLKSYCCHPYGSWALVNTSQGDLIGICKECWFMESIHSEKQHIPLSGIVSCDGRDYMLFFKASGDVVAEQVKNVSNVVSWKDL